ncbi:hypothetical protein JCM8202_003313 [Rhodotorula sphaerocarpa]
MVHLTLLSLSALALAPGLASATLAPDGATLLAAPHSMKGGRIAKHFGAATSIGNHYSHPKSTGSPDVGTFNSPPIKIAYSYSYSYSQFSFSTPNQAAATAAPVPDRPVSRKFRPNYGGQQTSSSASLEMSMSPAAPSVTTTTSKAPQQAVTTSQVPTTTSSSTAETTTRPSTSASTAPSSAAASSSSAPTTSSTSDVAAPTTTSATAPTTTTTTTTPTTHAATTTKATVSSATSSSTQAASPSSSPALNSLEAISLAAHNKLRAQHNATALTWNTELAAAAQKWADKCVFQHGGGTALNAGENISGYSASSASDSNVAYAISLWSNEASLYDWKNPGYSDATGHFTQMIWKDTTELGCAQTYCQPLHDAGNSFSWNGFFYVCEYLQAGNIVGSTPQQTAAFFSANVQK